jgi:hypothetical protein
MGTVGVMTTPPPRSRLIASILVAGSVAACAITGGTLGGREKCWPEQPPRMAASMLGTLHLDGVRAVLDTNDGGPLPLGIDGFSQRMENGTPALVDGNGSVVALDGEIVTMFGGIGADERMVLCAVEARGAPAQEGARWSRHGVVLRL